MYLRDTLGAVGIELILPDLRRISGVESGDSGNFTVTSAVAALEAAVESIPAEKRPVRIIGSSLGAYVAAVYASKPENQGAVDRVMLLAPPFKLDALLAEGRLEKSLGVTLSDEFKADAALHPPFPFLTCRAYVVHGYDDEAAPLANSLTWVRDASVNMRAGATANEGEVAAERRLLEVGGMGHSIEDGLPQIKAKLIDFFKLPFVLPEGFE
jgi:pimeloyl-ACP methyl ester carboxylesterase